METRCAPHDAAVAAELSPGGFHGELERTPRKSAFAVFAYETTEPRKYRLDPGTSVSIEDARPPVHDSASARVLPDAARRLPTTAARSSESDP